MVAPVASRRGCAALGRAVPRSGRAFGLADAPPDPCGSVGVMSCVRACLPRRWLASAWGRPAPLPDAVDGAAEGRAARRSTCTGARTSAGSLARGSARLPRRDARVPGQCMVLPRSVPRTRRGGLAGRRIAAARFPGSQRRPDRGRIRGRGRGQGMTSRPRGWAVAGSGGGGEGAECRRLGCGFAGGRSAVAGGCWGRGRSRGGVTLTCEKRCCHRRGYPVAVAKACTVNRLQGLEVGRWRIVGSLSFVASACVCVWIWPYEWWHRLRT